MFLVRLYRVILVVLLKVWLFMFRCIVIIVGSSRFRWVSLIVLVLKVLLVV